VASSSSTTSTASDASAASDARAPGGGPRSRQPVGVPTRGTTAPNRLRRVDRWLIDACARPLRAAGDPLVVDLGYGASPVTTLELARRLRSVRADVEVVGIELDGERVRAAHPFAEPGVGFVRGGFELPLAGRSPVIVRALNVLRQYDEGAVPEAWRRMQARLAPGGRIVEGTCDEPGRIAAWVTLDASRPLTLTLSARPASLERPSDLAERLPKALIHRNVPGERVHAFLAALDRAWERAAAYGAFGPRQRWVNAVDLVRSQGWPVVGGRSRWRLGEVTVDWSAVAPAGPAQP
jgi:hypothetical protein